MIKFGDNVDVECDFEQKKYHIHISSPCVWKNKIKKIIPVLKKIVRFAKIKFSCLKLGPWDFVYKSAFSISGFCTSR